MGLCIFLIDTVFIIFIILVLLVLPVFVVVVNGVCGSIVVGDILHDGLLVGVSDGGDRMAACVRVCVGLSAVDVAVCLAMPISYLIITIAHIVVS